MPLLSQAAMSLKRSSFRPLSSSMEEDTLFAYHCVPIIQYPTHSCRSQNHSLFWKNLAPYGSDDTKLKDGAFA